MNIKNAFGFLVLGLLMHLMPMIAQSVNAHAVPMANDSVRAMWLALMSWVIGGIGSTYVVRAGVMRASAALAALAPRPQAEPAQLPAGARVGAAN